MERNEIKINVVGKSASGKSTIMLMIAEMLRNNGVENVTVTPHLESIDAMILSDKDNDMKNEVLKSINIEIKEVPYTIKF